MIPPRRCSPHLPGYVAILILCLSAQDVCQETEVIGVTLMERFAPPSGYERLPIVTGSFAHSLRMLPVRPDSSRIRQYDGSPAGAWPLSYGIVDLEMLFDDDLEQCADWPYRLYADYLRNQELEHRICFQLQNGQTHSWAEWRSGNRLQFDQRLSRHVTDRAAPDSSWQSYVGYLRYLFLWAGSLALQKYLTPVLASELLPGDLIVQNTTGAVGHVSLILDICANSRGERLYLIGNGWTPAQEFFIRQPDDGEGHGYWFTLDGYARHLKRFNFGPFQFRRF